ncbi:hypothetical protein X733_22950 [Mesorhizobium sp. L2C067A000]|nr:hypothetical protein X733_22950 [Mesorhizobium sp. L2C067A000]
MCRGLGFAQGDQAHIHRLALLECQPGRRFADFLPAALQVADEIERPAVGVEPSRVFPRRAHNNIAALRHHLCDPLGLQIGAVTDADLARLGLALVGDLEEVELLALKLEGAVHAPKTIAACHDRPLSANLQNSQHTTGQDLFQRIECISRGNNPCVSTEPPARG